MAGHGPAADWGEDKATDYKENWGYTYLSSTASFMQDS